MGLVATRSRVASEPDPVAPSWTQPPLRGLMCGSRVRAAVRQGCESDSRPYPHP